MNNQALGLAGELRVMSELIMHGFNPAKSYLDNGVDIILENGTKIQVKTCNSVKKRVGVKQTTELYVFNLGKGNKKKKVKVSSYADFLICFIPKKDLFFIIPANDVGNTTSLSMTIKKGLQTKYHKYINKFNLLRR